MPLSNEKKPKLLWQRADSWTGTRNIKDEPWTLCGARNKKSIKKKEKGLYQWDTQRLTENLPMSKLKKKKKAMR